MIRKLNGLLIFAQKPDVNILLSVGWIRKAFEGETIKRQT